MTKPVKYTCTVCGTEYSWDHGRIDCMKCGGELRVSEGLLSGDPVVEKTSQVEKLRTASRQWLEDGERILLSTETRQFRPKLSWVVVTDRRIVGLMFARSVLPNESVAFTEIAGYRLQGTDSANRLLVVLKDGSVVSFGNISAGGAEDEVIARLQEWSGGRALGPGAISGHASGKQARQAHRQRIDQMLLERRLAEAGVLTQRLSPEEDQDPASHAVPADADLSSLPTNARPLAKPLFLILAQAETFSAAGDMAREEVMLLQARNLPKLAHLAGTPGAAAWVEKQIQCRLDRGTIRRGVSHLCTVGDVLVLSDRVIQGDRVHPLDGHTKASVSLDGQIIVSQRPTLTRMAVGSVLPGTALIPGLAFQKKTTTDTRVALFTIAHPDWVVSTQIDPDSIALVRPFADRVNAHCQRIDSAASADADGTLPGDRLERLERLQRLIESGLISPEQAKELSREIMGQ